MIYEIYGDRKNDATLLAIPALGERKEFYLPLTQTVEIKKYMLI